MIYICIYICIYIVEVPRFLVKNYLKIMRDLFFSGTRLMFKARNSDSYVRSWAPNLITEATSTPTNVWRFCQELDVISLDAGVRRRWATYVLDACIGCSKGSGPCDIAAQTAHGESLLYRLGHYWAILG